MERRTVNGTPFFPAAQSAGVARSTALSAALSLGGLCTTNAWEVRLQTRGNWMKMMANKSGAMRLTPGPVA
jgi:hypothetical protein